MDTKLKLYFKGGTFVNNPKIHLWLNGREIDADLRAKGFEIEESIQDDGPLRIRLKFGLRDQEFVLERDSGESLDLELKYSRLWGNFKLKERA